MNALMVWPIFPDSFWSFRGSMQIFGKKANQPPLGLLTVAALCPKSWSIKLVDEAVEPLTDADLLWADLVMVSGMQAQRTGIHAVLRRARDLGVRTIIGGPYASSQPDEVIDLADHVVVGEPDEVFDQIARDLEAGTAKRLYEIGDKPDVTRSPVPRFDLLKPESYAVMAVQFSRGCPFQCEFCDIITIYGRRPRTKTPDQLLAELDALYDLGRREPVFLVDDNFIGNRKRAFELLERLARWQQDHHYPFMFFTEASINLAQWPEMIDVMVAANFAHVFIGIESPSADSLAETRKSQNLREDLHESLRKIQSGGLSVMGGFIVGFDSDREDIFDRQVEFITEAAIPFAMIGMLQAPPTTPLYERMRREGRLHVNPQMTHNFDLPNFQTVLPTLTLARGYRETLRRLYEPAAYFSRGLDSLRRVQTRPPQRPADLTMYTPAILLRSIWYQGLRSSYRRFYWRFLWRLLRGWARNPMKLSLGFMILLSAQHFIGYAATVVSDLDSEIRRLEDEQRPVSELVAT